MFVCLHTMLQGPEKRDHPKQPELVEGHWRINQRKSITVASMAPNIHGQLTPLVVQGQESVANQVLAPTAIDGKLY